MTNPELINPERYRELVALMGKDLPVLLDTFRTHGEEQLVYMRRALAEADAPALAAAAHQLKGSAGNVGAVALSVACSSIEARARAGILESADEEVERICDLHRHTVMELANRLHEAG